jgi:hypothetical protein
MEEGTQRQKFWSTLECRLKVGQLFLVQSSVGSIPTTPRRGEPRRRKTAKENDESKQSDKKKKRVSRKKSECGFSIHKTRSQRLGGNQNRGGVSLGMDEGSNGIDLVSPVHGCGGPIEVRGTKKNEAESKSNERGEGEMGNEWRQGKNEETDHQGKTDESRGTKGPSGRKGLPVGGVSPA